MQEVDIDNGFSVNSGSDRSEEAAKESRHCEIGVIIGPCHDRRPYTADKRPYDSPGDRGAQTHSLEKESTDEWVNR